MKRYDIYGRLLEDTEPDAACYFTRFEDAQAEITEQKAEVRRVESELMKDNANLLKIINNLRDELTAANLERDALKGLLRKALNVWHNYRITSTDTEDSIESEIRSVLQEPK